MFLESATHLQCRDLHVQTSGGKNTTSDGSKTAESPGSTRAGTSAPTHAHNEDTEDDQCGNMRLGNTLSTAHAGNGVGQRRLVAAMALRGPRRVHARARVALSLRAPLRPQRGSADFGVGRSGGLPQSTIRLVSTLDVKPRGH